MMLFDSVDKSKVPLFIGFSAGFVIAATLYTKMYEKQLPVSKVMQVVYGRAKDENQIACTIVPNPWPGHSNIFFITSNNVGVLQFELNLPSYETQVKYIHRELSNPPVVESGMPVYK